MIGKLEKVELRDIWKNEAHDFTVWLEANLDALSEALDMNLEVIEREKTLDGSGFSVDLLCETEDSELVVVENQLEKTDHKHLGQIITYVSNLNADYAIWVCKNPRQEHINAINWLNEMVADKNFYLVQLEAFQIGESEAAPFFSVICKPDTDVKKLGAEKKDLNSKKKARRARRKACDTVIVPARPEGFEKVFLGENQWYAIRLGKARLEQIQYIAAYQVSPISSVTHIAKVKEIVPYKDSGKFLVRFDGKAKEIKSVPTKETKNSPQGPVYVEREKLLESKNLEDALSVKEYLPKTA